MKKLLIILCISLISIAGYSQVKTARDSLNPFSARIAGLSDSMSIIWAELFPPTPPTTSNVHPITHDQYYVSHPNVANGDYIGYVHYLCTDSIFNDRSGDSYQWTIVSGNTGSAFAVNSSTGLLTVNDYTAVTEDFSLYVEIDYGGDKDTAVCTIEYRTGTEGSVLVYVDADDAGSDAGTFANPYQDLTAVDGFGEFDDGMTVLLKRGTDYTLSSSWGIDNQGEKIVLAAYGQGAKPRLIPGNSDELQMIKLGQYHAPGSGTDGVDDCDSLVVMDIHFDGYYSTSYNWYAIYHEVFSDNNQYWRLYADEINNGNGTFDCVGEHNMELIVRDCGVYDLDRYEGWRAFKFESWGVDLENVWATNLQGPGIMCGLWGHDVGSFKYVYLHNEYPVREDPGFQIRDRKVNIEWFVTQGFGRGIALENYYYGSYWGDPNPRSLTAKNGLIIGAVDGIYFWDENDASEAGDFDTCRFENIAVLYSTGDGIDLDVHGCTDCNIIDELDLDKFLVVDAGESGIDIPDASEIADIRIYSGIIWNSTSTDILTQTTMSGAVIRNTIYNTVTSTSHFGTWGGENYDWGTSGDPFVNSAGGDYTTDPGETGTIIDQGYDVGQTEDIIGNEITTQDVGPFEYGGGNYNWTDRE